MESLKRFAAAIETRPEQFRPEGLPNFNHLLQRTVHYPEFAKAFAWGRQQRIKALCERGLQLKPHGAARRGRAPAYTEEAMVAALAALRIYTGRLRDFRPVGLPSYQTLRVRSGHDAGFRAKFHAVSRDRNPRFLVRTPSAAEAAAFLLDIANSQCRSKTEFAEKRLGTFPSWSWALDHAERDAAFRLEFDGALKAKGWDKQFYSTPAGASFAAARGEANRVYTAEDRARVLAAIASGEHITKVFGQNGAPSQALWWKWYSKDPELKRQYLEAKAAGRASRIAAKPVKQFKARAAKAKPLVRNNDQLRGQLLQDTLFAAANAALGPRTKHMDENFRFGVISDLIEAALAGEIEIEDMAEEAPFYISEHRRQLNSNPFSLDKRIGNEEGGGMTYLERLTTDDYGYAE